MTTDILNKEKRQRSFFRKNFDDLYGFIKESDLTHDGSAMHVLLYAYDFDEHGRDKLREEGKSEKEIDGEFKKRKESCKWKIEGVEESDVLLGIEAFFHLTSTGSGVSGNFTDFRNKMFETYFEQSCRTQEEKGKKVKEVDESLAERLREIFGKETLLAQILKYFGVARNDKGYGIGELESVLIPFAKKYNKVANDESCVKFVTAFQLFRTLRNIYAVHEDKPEEVLKKDYSTFHNFFLANITGALRFCIYFYVTLCTLVNRAWRKANELESDNREKGKPTMHNSTTYRELLDFELRNPLFKNSNVEVMVHVKFVPLPGQTIESVSCNNEVINVQPDHEGCVTMKNLSFHRNEKPKFIVKFSAQDNEANFIAELNKHEVWNETTIVFKQGEGTSYEYEDGEDAAFASKPETVSDVKQTEDLKGEKNTQKPRKITEYCRGWTLEFYPDSPYERSDEEDYTCCLSGIVGRGYEKRIVIPERVWSHNPVKSFRVTSISSWFWKKFEEYGGGLIGLPESIKNIHDVPNNVEVFTNKSWYSGKEFTYKAKSGQVYKCAYRENDKCSIIGIEIEEGKETPTQIDVPEYACGLLVSEIGEGAFARIKANDIILPYCVDTVGEGAFAGSSIWRMRFPKDVKEISAHTFENCKFLQTFESDGRIESLGEYVFAGCEELILVRLSKADKTKGESLVIEFPDGQVPKGAFMNCFKLKSAFIEVMQIKDKAFGGCTGLTEVCSYRTVSDKEFRTEEIGESAFGNCIRLNSIFGAERGDFATIFERNPHRKKLVRVFDSDSKLFDVNRQAWYNLIFQRWGWAFGILGLVVDAFIIYYVGRYFGWW